VLCSSRIKDVLCSSGIKDVLCSSGVKGETESLIIAAQSQALNTSYHQRNIMKQPSDIKFIMSCKAKEHQNILLQDAQHLRHLNTLTDAIRWPVTSTGRYVNIWGYRLLTGTVNIYRTGS